jgi:hypothetical protein
MSDHIVPIEPDIVYYSMHFLSIGRPEGFNYWKQLYMTYLDELDEFGNAVVPLCTFSCSTYYQVKPSTTTMAIAHEEEEK